MKNKQVKKYFERQIEGEVIPSFETVRSRLDNGHTSRRREWRVTLAFYSAFSSIVVLVIAASFLTTSTFSAQVAARYKEADFSSYAQEKISRAGLFLSEIRTAREKN